MISMMVLLYIFITIILIILYVQHSYKYWTRYGIMQVTPSFPFGNMQNLLLKKNTFGQTFKMLYDYFKLQKQVVGGYYFVLGPELVIVDTELIKCILTKDFSSFMDRGIYLDEKNDPLSAHLFALPGEKWRPLRMKLSPTFTSGKIKTMFPTLTSCGYEMTKVLNDLISSCTSQPIDIKDIFARLTTDVIGSCAFGIDCNALHNPNNDFRKYGNKILDMNWVDEVRQMLVISFPNIMKLLGIPGINPIATQFFLNVVRDTIKYREMNNIKRNDFMQLLLELKDENKNGNGLNVEQIAAQCFVFFLAGFETSSTTMSFCLYELAANQDIQNTARNEIMTVLQKYNNELTYEGIMEMHYLNKCISETLRKYPPLPFINRDVTTDYKIPGTKHILKKGIPVVISVEGLHWDPEFYPEPEKFDPERFNEEEKLKRPQYSYLPFGEGPRICIGLRFGLLQSKLGLVEVLRNFQCSVNEKTKTPLTMTSKSFITTAEGGIWLNMKKIA